MKKLLVLCTVIFGVYSVNGGVLPSVTTPLRNRSFPALPEIDISGKIDEKLVEFRQMILEKGYDPATLPDVTRKIAIKPAFITHYGKFKLRNGWLQDLRTLKRNGPTFLKIKLGGKGLIKANLVIERLEFGYDYSAKLLGMGPSGQIVGNVKEIQIYAELDYNLLNGKEKIKKAELVSMGKLKVKLRGNILTDQIANILVAEITNAIHDSLEDYLNEVMQDYIDQQLELKLI